MSIHRYDTETFAAAQLSDEADEDYRLGRGLQGLPGFYRRHHWNLTRDRSQGLHWLYVASSTAATCTCGLLLPAATTDLLASDGHLDPRTDQPTRVLVIHAVADATGYTAACQTCGWQHTTPHVGRSRSLADQHANTCPALPTGKAAPGTPHP